MSKPQRRSVPAGIPEPPAGVPAPVPSGEAWLWLVAVAATAWSFGFTIMRGSDLWWHLAGGRWMVENFTVWVPDPYSYTAAGRPWVNDAWLSDVLLYLWSTALGTYSLAYWKWILIGATWTLLFRLLVRLGAERLHAYACVVLSLAVAAPFLDVRPQLYSFLCWVILLDGTLGRDQPVRWLPLVFLLWVNLHASFLLGVLSLPVALLPNLLDRRRQRSAVALVAACWAICLVNPSGIEVVLRPLRYFVDSTSPFRTLGEWLPPFEPGGIQSAAYPYAIGVFAFAAVANIFQAGRRNSALAWSEVGLGLLTLALSLHSRRFVPVFAIGQCFAVARTFASQPLDGLRKLPPFFLPAIALLLASYWMLPFPMRSYAFVFLTAEYEFPVELLNFANQNGLQGNTFAYYNWGGYVQWRTDGRMKVFIDGRSETIYSDETFNRYLIVLHERPGWLNVIEDGGADYVVWPASSPRIAAALVGTGRWERLYEDYAGILLARTGKVDLAQLRATPDSPHRRLKLGLEAMAAKDYARAEAELRRALNEQPYLQPACLALVRVRLLQGNRDAALEQAEACRGIYPDKRRDDLMDRWFASSANAVAPE